MTAATILGAVLLAGPILRRGPAIVRLLLAVGAAFGYVRILDNFVANSRVSALPDHIVPATPVQAVIFAALLLLAFAVAYLFLLIFSDPARTRATPFGVAAAAMAIAARM